MTVALRAVTVPLWMPVVEPRRVTDIPTVALAALVMSWLPTVPAWATEALSYRTMP